MPLSTRPLATCSREWGCPVTPSPKAPGLSAATVMALFDHARTGVMLSRSASVFDEFRY